MTLPFTAVGWSYTLTYRCSIGRCDRAAIAAFKTIFPMAALRGGDQVQKATRPAQRRSGRGDVLLASFFFFFFFFIVGLYASLEKPFIYEVQCC